MGCTKGELTVRFYGDTCTVLYPLGRQPTFQQLIDWGYGNWTALGSKPASLESVAARAAKAWKEKNLDLEDAMAALVELTRV